MIRFEELKYKIGQRLWDYNSQSWLTLEKIAILSKENYIQFKELPNVFKYKDFNLYYTEIRKDKRYD